jgi:hypothetical protein
VSRTPTPADAMERVWAELNATTRRLPRNASRGTLDTFGTLRLDRKSLLSFDEFQAACAAFGKRDAFNHLHKVRGPPSLPQRISRPLLTGLAILNRKLHLTNLSD